MDDRMIFILISVFAMILLLGIFVFFLLRRKKHQDLESKALSPLAGIAFGCIAAGIILGDARWWGYGLMGLGVVLSIIDAVLKLRKT